MNYLRREDVDKIQATLPAGLRVIVDETLLLEGGLIWTFRICSWCESVCISIEKYSFEAFAARMPIVFVEEDRYQPRWREKFGDICNAVKRATQILQDGVNPAPIDDVPLTSQ